MTRTPDDPFVLPGARIRFSTVADGNLAFHVGDDEALVRENRQRLGADLGRTLVFVSQVHSADVAVIDSARDAQRLPSGDVADALVTNRSDLALAIMVADCVPILFSDADAGVIGGAHAGRRGLLDGVVGNTVRSMVELGASRDRINAVIGPSVCGLCYEVPESMREDGAARIPEVASCTRWGTPALDLKAGAAACLIREGVREDAIADVGVCTLEDHNFFSYRRDSRTGRCAGVITRT